MEKTPRETPTVYNSTDAVSMDFDGSCFGVEYQPRTVQCQRCHDSTLCNIKYQETVTKKVKEVENSYNMLDTEQVPDLNSQWAKDLKATVDKYHAEGEPVTREELVEAIVQEYKINDPKAAYLWTDRWIEKFNASQLIA